MKRNIFILLLAILIISLSVRIFQYREEYLEPFDSKYWEMRYNQSQWVVPESKISIGDDGLYAYSGWEYIHGRDPSLLNAEVPPLGKYLIGLTEIVLRNQNLFGLLSGFFVLTSLFYLNKIIFKNNALAVLPVIILSFDPLFYGQLKAPYLDNLYLAFLIMVFIMFHKEKYIWANVFLGLMASTKASLPTLILVPAVLCSFLFYMRQGILIKKYLINYSVAILIFLASYGYYFWLGSNLYDFLKLQKWILNFYDTGVNGSPQVVWQIIFTGYWDTWWGQRVRVEEWSFLWPMGVFGLFFYTYKVILKKKKYKSVLQAFWILAYLGFLMAIPVWPRYLLLILPFTYILIVWIFTKSRLYKLLYKYIE